MLDICFQLHPDNFQIYDKILGEMRRDDDTENINADSQRKMLRD